MSWVIEQRVETTEVVATLSVFNFGWWRRLKAGIGRVFRNGLLGRTT